MVTRVNVSILWSAKIPNICKGATKTVMERLTAIAKASILRTINNIMYAITNS